MIPIFFKSFLNTQSRNYVLLEGILIRLEIYGMIGKNIRREYCDI